MNLSPNFDLAEFLVSETAARKGIRNDPGEAHIANLRKLAETLERVRALFGRPVVLTSGYRSRDLNQAIGGSPTSMHCHGLAADFIVPPIAVLEVCQRIAESDVKFDQLIYEYDWIHLGLGIDRERHEVLTKRHGRLLRGLVA